MEKLKLDNEFDIMDRFSTEQDCIDFLEEKRWNGNVVSPYDPDSKI